MPEVDPNTKAARDFLDGKDLGIPAPDDRKPVPPAAAIPATPATPASPATPEAPILTLEQIEAKVELGQDLTAEEQKFIEDQEKTLPPDQPLPVYRIAGEQIEYVEAEKRAREGMKMPAETPMTREAVETWVKAQNRSEFQKRTEQSSEKNSQARDSLIEQQKVLFSRERELIEKRAEYNANAKELQREAEQLQRKKAQLDRIIAAKPRQEDVIADPQNIHLGMQYTDALHAERDYAEFQQDAQRVTTEMARIKAEGQKIEGERLLIEANTFALQNPQYLPSSGDFIKTYSAFLRSEPLSDDDTEKMWEVNRIFNEAAYNNIKYDVAYKLLKKTQQLIVKDVQTPGNGQAATKIPQPLNKIEESMKRIQRIRERQAGAPSRLPGDTRSSEASRTTPTAEQMARQKLEEERALRPGGGSSAGLFDGTLTTQQRVVPS